MICKYEAKFHLKQKVKIKDPGIIGHVMAVEFPCDAAPIFIVGLWDGNEFRTYRLDTWQLEAFKEKSVGIHEDRTASDLRGEF